VSKSGRTKFVRKLDLIVRKSFAVKTQGVIKVFLTELMHYNRVLINFLSHTISEIIKL
jgi:hypothetical protein